MTEEVRNQHYVPQSYLKYFQIEGQKRINVYHKPNKNSFTNSISKVACLDYFYDLPKEIEEGTGIAKQFIEKLLSQTIEKEFPIVAQNLIDSLENNTFKNFNSNQINLLADFIIIQYSRTKQFRDDSNQLYLDTYKELMYSLIEKNFPLDKYPKSIYPTIEMPEELKVHNHIKRIAELFTDKKLQSHLKKYIWIVLKNETDNYFITSDHPVVTYLHRRHDAGYIAGLFIDGNEIAFPLSPRYMLVFLESNYFEKLLNGERVLKINEPEYVKFYNYLQAKDSYQQVYSSNNDFSIFDEINQRFPDILTDGKKKHEVISTRDQYGKEYQLSRFLDKAVREGKIIGKSFLKDYLDNL